MEGNSWVLGFGPSIAYLQHSKADRSIFEKSLEYGPGTTLWPMPVEVHVSCPLPSSLSCFMTVEETFSLWLLNILRLLKDECLPTLGVDEVGRREEVMI